MKEPTNEKAISFSALDESDKLLVVELFAETLEKDRNQVIDQNEILRVLNLYNIDLEKTDYGWYDICAGDKLKKAIKHLITT